MPVMRKNSSGGENGVCVSLIEGAGLPSIVAPVVMEAGRALIGLAREMA